MEEMGEEVTKGMASRVRLYTGTFAFGGRAILSDEQKTRKYPFWKGCYAADM